MQDCTAEPDDNDSRGDSPPRAVLHYGRSEQPGWRSVSRWVLRFVSIVLLAYAAWWSIDTVFKAYSRYRFMNDYQQGYAGLKAYTLPTGQVILDPNAGPMMSMKPYQNGAVSGTIAVATIPPDPIFERNLHLMGMSASFDPYVYACERQTAYGLILVTGRMEHLNMPHSLHLRVETQKRSWGGFPLYSESFFFNYEVGIDVMPPDEKTRLPTVLAGYSDTNLACWILPLILNGKPEWIRFDHSTTPPRVTASFGHMINTGTNWRLEY